MKNGITKSKVLAMLGWLCIAAGIVMMLMFTATPARAATTITTGFSRGVPSAKDVVLQAINDATSSIYLAGYQFSSKDIIQALMNAKKRGVDVHVVLDRNELNGEGQALMVASGIGCKIDQKFRIMHHKFIVTDGKNVETGSFNFSTNADKANAENAIYIRAAPKLAAAYKAQWDWVNNPPANDKQPLACPGGGT